MLPGPRGCTSARRSSRVINRSHDDGLALHRAFRTGHIIGLKTKELHEQRNRSHRGGIQRTCTQCRQKPLWPDWFGNGQPNPGLPTRQYILCAIVRAWLPLSDQQTHGNPGFSSPPLAADTTLIFSQIVACSPDMRQQKPRKPADLLPTEIRRVQSPGTKVDSFTIPIRSGQAWKVPAGHVCRLLTVDGPQVADLNIWNYNNPRERSWAARTRQLQAAHFTTFDRLWSNLPTCALWQRSPLTPCKTMALTAKADVSTTRWERAAIPTSTGC